MRTHNLDYTWRLLYMCRAGVFSLFYFYFSLFVCLFFPSLFFPSEVSHARLSHPPFGITPHRGRATKPFLCYNKARGLVTEVLPARRLCSCSRTPSHRARVIKPVPHTHPHTHTPSRGDFRSSYGAWWGPAERVLLHARGRRFLVPRHKQYFAFLILYGC